MANRPPLAIGEWYHCYNRGVDKRRVFHNKEYYERFLFLIYIANRTERVHTSHLKSTRLAEVLADTTLDNYEPLVEIGAYTLMPNHLHIAVREIRDGGIATFMQKVFTGYTMYFNKRHERTGSLFASTYKSKHVDDDRYMKQLIHYIHLNPVEIIEPRWKEGKGNIKKIEKWLLTYPYSSLPDFSTDRPEKKILGTTVFELFDKIPSVQEMLEEAQEYYQSAEVKPRRKE